jgi:hypothetical protein
MFSSVQLNAIAQWMGSRDNDQWNLNGLVYYNGMYYIQNNDDWLISCDFEVKYILMFL